MNATETRCERYSRGERPPLLGVHAAAPDLYPALLESSAPHPTAGRLDILLAGAGAKFLDEDFLGALERCWQRERRPSAAGRLPFAGGWLIYLGYELAGEIEPILQLPQSAAPRAFAQRMHGAVIYDHADKSTWLTAEVGHEALLDELAAALARAQDPRVTNARALTSLEEEPAELFCSA